MLYIQETKWKGSNARELGAGYKLYYHGVDGMRNGVRIIVKKGDINGVLEVYRESDRVMSMMLEIEGVGINIVSAYAPQVDCDMEEKDEFWERVEEGLERLPKEERVIVGADFNGHIGEKTETMRKSLGSTALGLGTPKDRRL